VVGFGWNAWSVSVGIGGRHQLEFMVGLGWNMQVWLQWLELARSGAFLQSSSAGEAFRELTGQLLNTFCGEIP